MSTQYCHTCGSLAEQINRAETQGDRDRAKALRATLDNHRRDCQVATGKVGITSNMVEWPNGTTWFVR